VSVVDSVPSYLDERGEEVLVFRWTSSASGIFEVQVKAIEVSFPQEIDGGRCELSSAFRRLQHGRHSVSSKVPSSDGQHSLHA